MLGGGRDNALLLSSRFWFDMCYKQELACNDKTLAHERGLGSAMLKAEESGHSRQVESQITAKVDTILMTSTAYAVEHSVGKWDW